MKEEDSHLSVGSQKGSEGLSETLAGETLTLADGIDNAIILAILFSELTTGETKRHILPVVCATDNYSLVDAVKSTEKRLGLEISSIKDLIQACAGSLVVDGPGVEWLPGSVFIQNSKLS